MCHSLCWNKHQYSHRCHQRQIRNCRTPLPCHASSCFALLPVCITPLNIRKILLTTTTVSIFDLFDEIILLLYHFYILSGGEALGRLLICILVEGESQFVQYSFSLLSFASFYRTAIIKNDTRKNDLFFLANRSPD